MKCVIFLLALICSTLSAPLEDEAVQEFIEGNHKFSSDVYREIIKAKEGSFIASPFSAETILALTNEGARGQTSAELMASLALPSSDEKIHEAFKSFSPKLTKSKKHLKLLSANKIYVGEGVELKDEFKDVATRIYNSGIDNVDFTQNIEAAKTINDWVEENTNHKIENLVDPDNVNTNTRMILVNALYFSGLWVHKFNVNDTIKKNFYKSEKGHELLRKSRTGRKVYGTSICSEISMVIVLPDEKEGLANLEEHIDELFEPQAFTMEKVDIELPKFKIETKIEFVPILQNLGIKEAFADADFSGISSTHKDLAISDVLQKAFIDVTELGTEAAAATSGGITSRIVGGKLLPGETTFYADHPFFYYIKHGDLVLFAGRYTN